MIITDDIKQRVADERARCYAIADKHFGRVFPRCRVHFDVDSASVAGLACYRENLVRLNKRFMAYDLDEAITNTLPHEIAHLLTWQVWRYDPHNPLRANGRTEHHGWQWKAMMVVLGQVPDVYHSMPRQTRGRDISEFV
jgi:SprT protein